MNVKDKDVAKLLKSGLGIIWANHCANEEELSSLLPYLRRPKLAKTVGDWKRWKERVGTAADLMRRAGLMLAGLEAELGGSDDE